MNAWHDAEFLGVLNNKTIASKSERCLQNVAISDIAMYEFSKKTRQNGKEKSEDIADDETTDCLPFYDGNMIALECWPKIIWESLKQYLLHSFQFRTFLPILVYITTKWSINEVVHMN